MISKITGKLEAIIENRAVIEHKDSTSGSGFAYDVFIPSGLIKKLLHDKGEIISLFTFHYLEGGANNTNPIPRLIGFLNEIDKEFFEKLISVKGFGTKKALKALIIPVCEIAAAIESKDTKTLQSLPEVGKRTAEQIIAELHGRVAKFALMKEGIALSEEVERIDFKDEVIEVLLQLGYKTQEAEIMIKKAIAKNKAFKSAEEMIQEIYRMKDEG